MSTNKTHKNYWNNIYNRRTYVNDIDLSKTNNFIDLQIFEKLTQVELKNKFILEIGAGDSAWLIFLAKHFPESTFAGLDYSESGCNNLHKSAVKNNVTLKIFNSDLFKPPRSLINSVDVLYSIGVVEHFEDLAKTMQALSKYMKPEGKIFTLIPNMNGMIGAITKFLNPAIYYLHNPHNLNSFISEHKKAGLEVLDAGLLCSNNFGVLSACVRRNMGIKFQIYRVLAKASSLTWRFEKNYFKLPTTNSFSPYIYAISVKP